MGIKSTIRKSLAIAKSDSRIRRHFNLRPNHPPEGFPDFRKNDRKSALFRLFFREEIYPIFTHCRVFALSRTASHTFWVCNAFRKSGCVGLPLSIPAKKSASAFVNVCS